MAVQSRDLAQRLRRNEVGSHSFEFLVVCKDSAIFKNVAGAVRAVSGRLICTPKISIAGDYIARRNVDGIVVDMALPGALDLIRRVRSVGSNRGSVVFACMGAAAETQFAIRAGANFVLHRPLTLEKITHIFGIASGMMAAEKRRYFRYPLMVPVELNTRGRQVESTLSNLSEGGMAIWSLYYQAPGSSVQFTFEVPSGGTIRGNGEVTWMSPDGLAGIKFQILPDQAYTYLSEWIARRDLKNVG